jgi:hypothetical protein
MLSIMIMVILILTSVELSPYLDLSSQNRQGKPSDFYVGVSFCGKTTAQAELLIDKVKGYTNLFVVQSGPVSVNETALNEIVSYAVSSGLDVVVFFGYFNPHYPWQVPWLDYAKQQWGSHFLGVYLGDEPGGSTIDANWTGFFNQLRIRDSPIYVEHLPTLNQEMNSSLPIDNNGAAYHFVTDLQTGSGLNQLESRSINSFTSDYALYWFDYLGGYDTVFAEFGSNQSITQAIDLTRGAAYLQNKTWGDIITWTYNQPPYLENATAMYNQLVAGYTAGAKYEVIFDYPQSPGDPYGVLTDQQFAALEKFWNNIPTLKVNSLAEAALVLPENYGWGMRSPQDMIWGLWKPDATSTQIWNISQKLQAEYGSNLDIVFQDPQFPVEGKYQQIYYWNQTT